MKGDLNPGKQRLCDSPRKSISLPHIVCVRQLLILWKVVAMQADESSVATVFNQSEVVNSVD